MRNRPVQRRGEESGGRNVGGEGRASRWWQRPRAPVLACNEMRSISTWSRYGPADQTQPNFWATAPRLKIHLCQDPLPPSSLPPPPWSLQTWTYVSNNIDPCQRVLIVPIQPAFVQNLHSLLVQFTSNDTVQLKAVSHSFPRSPLNSASYSYTFAGNRTIEQGVLQESTMYSRPREHHG